MLQLICSQPEKHNLSANLASPAVSHVKYNFGRHLPPKIISLLLASVQHYQLETKPQLGEWCWQGANMLLSGEW